MTKQTTIVVMGSLRIKCNTVQPVLITTSIQCVPAFNGHFEFSQMSSHVNEPVFNKASTCLMQPTTGKIYSKYLKNHH